VTDPTDDFALPAATPTPSKRVVCIGSAALDVLMEIDVMPPEDGRIAARDGLLAGGGPAATAAVTLARLGVPVDLISVVGDDVAGDLIVGGLDREHVGTRFVRRAPGARSALSVGLIRPRPASTRSLVALAPIGATIDIDEDALEACRTASWIHVDHAGWRLVAWLRSQGIETPVAVDGGNPLDPHDLRGADLYVPGQAELLRSTGSTDIAAALAVVTADDGPLTIVTLGAEGSTYRGSIDPDGPSGDHLVRTRRRATPGRALVYPRYGAHVPSPSVDVRSTLGAGDVYHGALLAGLLDGRSIRGAMAYASTTAALSCAGMDGRSAIPTHEQVVAAIARFERPDRASVGSA
jgi:sulfofructose kinase